MSVKLSKRQWVIIKWIYPPIGWGLGASLIAWMGVLQMDLLSAFAFGFIIGLVHDIAMTFFDYQTWRKRNIKDSD
ncbi:MAG: hypothetical protein ACFFEE_09850 [Candidatus Thorarchaeota archaeon]